MAKQFEASGAAQIVEVPKEVAPDTPKELSRSEPLIQLVSSGPPGHERADISRQD